MTVRTTNLESGVANESIAVLPVQDEMVRVVEAEELPAPTGATSEDGRITNVFYESDLRQALQDLSAAAEMPIMVGPSVEGLVSADIKDKTLDEALQIVLSGTGYLVHKTPAYYVVHSADPESPGFLELSETQLYYLDHMIAVKAVQLLAPQLSQYVRPHPEGNTVVMTAPREIIDRIVAALDQIDKTPVQFLLTSRVVVMEKSDLLNLGVQWDFPTVQAGAFSSDARHGGDAPAGGSQWPWGIQVGYTPGGEFTDGLMAKLNALLVNEQASVQAEPSLMAQNGEQAVIQVTTEEYFEVLTQGFYTSSQLEKIQSGTTLSIVPFMGEEAHITLKLEAEVSDVVARGENNLPVVSRRITKNSVWIEDGGTAIIAGLTDNRTRQGDRKVPFLGRIPLVGRLFRNDIDLGSDREVAIFITARTITGRQDPQLQPALPPLDGLSQEIEELGKAERVRRDLDLGMSQWKQ